MPDFLSLPFEEDMTQAEIQALIEARLKRDLIWRFPFDATPNTGQVSAGVWSGGLRPPMFEADCTGPAAHKIAEYVVMNQYSLTTGTIFWPDYDLKINKIRSQATFVPGAGPDEYSFAGIEHGSFGTTTPFSAAPAGFVIQLRYRYLTGDFELLVGKGNAVAVSSTILTGTPTGKQGTSWKCELELVLDYPATTVYAYVNRVLGAQASFTGYGDLGVASSGLAPVGGIFITNGVTGDPGCLWSNFEYEITDYMS